MAVAALLIGAAHGAPAAPALRASESSAASGGCRTAAALEVYATSGAWQTLPPAEAGDTQVRCGYAATLYDPVTVNVSSPANTIPEGSIMPFTATLVCDDASLLPAGSDLAWSVSPGPLDVGAASGLATAEIVYADALAEVTAATEGLSGSKTVTVLNVDRDNFHDYAGDGLADDWQVGNFGLSNAFAAGTADPDGDGQDNAFEFIAGTQPTNAAHAFVLRIQPGAQVDVAFAPAYTSRAYRTEFTTDLVSGAWQPLTNSTEYNAGDQRIVSGVEQSHHAADYRVRIQYDWENQP
jgi:hypothetical protein